MQYGIPNSTNATTLPNNNLGSQGFLPGVNPMYNDMQMRMAFMNPYFNQMYYNQQQQKGNEAPNEGYNFAPYDPRLLMFYQMNQMPMGPMGYQGKIFYNFFR